MSSRSTRHGAGRGVGRREVGYAVVVVAVFAAVGAGAGWLWMRIWTPPPGEVGGGRWLYRDYLALANEFSAVAWYVVVGVVGGLLLGALAALLSRRAELLMLLAVVVGSAVAGWACLQVGQALAPPDPALIAASLPDGVLLDGALAMPPGRSWWVAWPLGSLIGLTVTYLATVGVDAGAAEVRRQQDDARWLAPAPPDRTAAPEQPVRHG